MPLPAIAAPLLAGGIGAAASALGGYLGSKNQPQNKRISNQTPLQNQVQNASLEDILKNLQGGFEPIEQNAIRQYNQKTFPSISERFTQQFGPGQRQGSGFQQINDQSRNDLISNLASMRSQFQQNRLGQLLAPAFKPAFDTIHTPQDQGIFGSALAGLAPALGALPFNPALYGQQDQNNSGGGKGTNDFSDILKLLEYYKASGQNTAGQAQNVGIGSNVGQALQNSYSRPAGY